GRCRAHGCPAGSGTAAARAGPWYCLSVFWALVLRPLFPARLGLAVRLVRHTYQIRHSPRYPARPWPRCGSTRYRRHTTPTPWGGGRWPGERGVLDCRVLATLVLRPATA